MSTSLNMNLELSTKLTNWILDLDYWITMLHGSNSSCPTPGLKDEDGRRFW
jgi:hypothetical protein